MLVPVRPTTATPAACWLSPLKTPPNAAATVSPEFVPPGSTGASVVLLASQTGACVTGVRVTSNSPALMLNAVPLPVVATLNVRPAEPVLPSQAR
jgi:hypothetical protein